jgi:aspartyl-tRNA(Asn)/glutamyl-tRNA(Gln) amidotransferase subunit C
MFEEQIEKIAELARIKLDEQEKKELAKSLNEIIEYVNKINDLNLDDFYPLFSLLENLPLREDKNLQIQNSEEIELIMKNFPELEDRYLKVPKILDK